METFSLVAIFMVLSNSDVVGSHYYCIEGKLKNSMDCYTLVDCDFSFPDVPITPIWLISLEVRKQLEYISGLRIMMNFTGHSHGAVSSKEIFSYDGHFSRMNHTSDRYFFQIKLEYVKQEERNYYPEVTKADLSFSIINLQREDAGIYHVSLVGYFGVFRYVYNIFTVYQPSTSLVCRGPSASLSGSYHVTFTCSIPDAFPPITVDVFEQSGCSIDKYLTVMNDIKELTVHVNSCNSTTKFACFAMQEQLEFMSESRYFDSCQFTVLKGGEGKLKTQILTSKLSVKFSKVNANVL